MSHALQIVEVVVKQGAFVGEEAAEDKMFRAEENALDYGFDAGAKEAALNVAATRAIAFLQGFQKYSPEPEERLVKEEEV